MKLLFDENISHKLVRALADLYPDCEHTKNVGLGAGDDRAIWDYAKNNDFMIVSKDADFYQRSLLLGHPPKIIWIRRGNCSTKVIETILRNRYDAIKNFYEDVYESILILL